MTETKEQQMKRLMYQSQHRGTREADLIFGPFAKKYLADFSEDQLNAYEHLLSQEDPDIYNWVVCNHDAPDDIDKQILSLIRDFKNAALT